MCVCMCVCCVYVCACVHVCVCDVCACVHVCVYDCEWVGVIEREIEREREKLRERMTGAVSIKEGKKVFCNPNAFLPKKEELNSFLLD